MSLLIEKLKILKDKEMEEEKARRARADYEKRLEEEQAAKRKEMIERMAQTVKKELQPTLQIVNEHYLGNKGEINEYGGEDKTEVSVNIELSWDNQRTRDGTAGKRIRAHLNHNRKVTVSGEGKGSPVIQLSLDKENFREKLEESIYSILTKPKACSWRKDFRGRDWQ